MSRFARMQVLESMKRVGLVPVYHVDDPGTAIEIAEALIEGGARTIEFTNRGDHAVETFSQVDAHLRSAHPEAMLGVGSVMDAETAGLYINLGAAFVVGPSTDQRIAAVCNIRKVAYAPGCGTMTEVVRAHELGCEIIKVFPGGLVGGPSFVSSVRGPAPWTEIMPTGGVDITEDSLRAWFDAGVACVGIGSKLVSKDVVASKDWPELTRRTRSVIDTIATIRANEAS